MNASLDKTYCQHYKSCEKGWHCPVAYTDSVKQEFVNNNKYCSLYTVHPECYKKSYKG